VNNVAHGELDDLAAPGARYVGDLHDLGGHVARRGVGADLAVDLLDEHLVQLAAGAQHDEEDDTGVVLPFLANDEALLDFVELFDLAVDLGRADAHAAGVQGRVRAAADNDAVMLGELDIIAVAPDVGELLEIGGAILLVVGIVPEADGHGGKGRGADQLALLAPERLAIVVPHFDLEAEAARLDLAAPNGADGIAEHEAGDNVGATGDRRETHVLLDGAVDVVEAFGHQRRTGRGDGAQGR
jgi:hypothetical protein